MTEGSGHATPPTNPLAFQLSVQEVTHEGQRVLQLVEQGALSSHRILLTPAHAIQIGDALAANGRRLASGLVLPPSQN